MTRQSSKRQKEYEERIEWLEAKLKEQQNMNDETVKIYNEIDAELQRSAKHETTFHNLHEAYAVILKEVDELCLMRWRVQDITRMERKDRDASELQKELIQIGAMVVKALTSIHNFVGGDV